MKQKRRHPRVQWLLPALFQRPGKTDSPGQNGWGTIRNLSVQGAEFCTRLSVELHDTLFVSFNVNQQHKFQNVPAKVVRLRNEGIYHICGLRFSEKVDMVNMENALSSLLSLTD